jgi:hypothetical protein
LTDSLPLFFKFLCGQILAQELKPFGFQEVGQDQDLLLRCFSAVITGSASASALVAYDGATVRSRFDEIRNGILGAIDFLRENLNIYALHNLPNASLLIPLCVFFAVAGNSQVVLTYDQRQAILRWFWRTCFINRYRSQPIKTVEADIEQILRLKRRESSKFGDITASITEDFFKNNVFRIDSVATTTFVLMLAQQQPLSFISGTIISLREVLKDYNRNEFHHLYPRAFLRNSAQDDYKDSCLANFSFMSRSDNNQLGGDPPSEYRKHMPADVNNVKEVLSHALCPDSLFSDNFKTFIDERAKLLTSEAKRLMDL